MNKVKLLEDCNNSLGEGITYSSINNNLYWLDIGNISKLYKLELSSNKKEIFELPEIVTATSIKSKDELIGDIITLLQSPAKNVIASLQSGGNKLSGIVKALQERKE